jgi:hypothetical protein
MLRVLGIHQQMFAEDTELSDLGFSVIKRRKCVGSFDKEKIRVT